MPPEFLRKVSLLGAPHQGAADYGLSASFGLQEELGRYWRWGSDLYGRYVASRERRDRDPSVAGVDRWLVPFCRRLLAYDDLASCDGRVVGERSYAITHQAWGVSVPFLLVTREWDLDKAVPGLGEEGTRIAPHALMQACLNADDGALWGIVANGLRLRVLRDNASLTRPAYVEADLELIFRDGLYAEFAAFWLFAHATRLRPVEGRPSRCIAEVWRTRAIQEGARVRERLRDGVEEALRQLGTGFLEHRANASLRASLSRGALSPGRFFQELLRLVYRLLFLFTTEDRDLLHPRGAPDASRRLYHEGYSVSRLRMRALRRRFHDRHGDLWQSLVVTFRCLGHGAPALALPPLGGLFGAMHCARLDAAQLSNARLLRAVRSLAFFRSGSALTRVNYRDMGAEELGSVYESLLDLHPVITQDPPSFAFVQGTTRKETGSYYTPPALVGELVRTALVPVMERALASHRADPRGALLGLRVLDPACGSGHFLLAAARRLAAELARLESDTDAYSELAWQHALRVVVQHCLYGVDRNALAVELCRTALWIEAVAPGKPLTFLDARIRHGDSLTGMLDASLMDEGIPPAAYQALAGDDRAVCQTLRKENRQSAYAAGSVQLGLYDEVHEADAAPALAAVAQMPEDTLEEVQQKEQAWQAATEDAAAQRERYRANLFVGAFFAHKRPETLDLVPTSKDLGLLREGADRGRAQRTFVEDIAERLRPLHWHHEFAAVLQKGGFDVVLANPPWERIELQEKEFFAMRAPEIAKAPNKAARQRLMEALRAPGATVSDRQLYSEYTTAKRTAEATSLFLHKSGRFPLTGTGKINTYAVFAETAMALLRPSGRAGLIVPTGIATDHTTRAWFNHVVEEKRLVSLYDFENRQGVFAGIDSRIKFSLVTLTGSAAPCASADYAFFLQQVAELSEAERHITLSAADFALFNPNTRTCPVFRSRRDAAIARKMYQRAGVLWQEQPEANPWAVHFYQMFNMSTDSRHFRTRAQLEEAGYALDGNVFVLGRSRYVPLYEAKLFHQYDHRFATFEGGDVRKGQARRVTPEEKHDPDLVTLPRYWVAEALVQERLRRMSAPRGRDNHVSEIGSPPPQKNQTAPSALDQLSALARRLCSGGSRMPPTSGR